MFSHYELFARAQRQDGVLTLSAYVPVERDTPTPVVAVQASLRHRFAQLRDQLRDATHAERESFDACASRLIECAGRDVHRQGGGTWVGFAGANGVTFDEMLAVALPLSVAWEPGMRIVPYLSACNDRPALVAMVDRTHARLFRYERGQLTELERIETKSDVEAGPHTNAPPRQGFHAGTHGETREEAVARRSAVDFSRHVSHVIDRVHHLDTGAEWIVVAGASVAVQRIAVPLTQRASARVGVADHITAAATEAQIRNAARAAVDVLVSGERLRIVNDLVTRRDGITRDVHGDIAVQSGAEHRAIGLLALSTHWINAHQADAESLVRVAVAQGASIEIADGDAGMELDRSAGGIAARLRYSAADPGPAFLYDGATA